MADGLGGGLPVQHDRLGRLPYACRPAWPVRRPEQQRPGDGGDAFVGVEITVHKVSVDGANRGRRGRGLVLHLSAPAAHSSKYRAHWPALHARSATWRSSASRTGSTVVILSPTGGGRRSVRALRSRCGQRQVEDRDALRRRSTHTDCSDQLVLCQIRLRPSRPRPAPRSETAREIVLEHGVKPVTLAFVTAVDGRFGDQ